MGKRGRQPHGGVPARRGSQALCLVMAVLLAAGVAIPLFAGASGGGTAGIEARNRQAFMEAGLPEGKADAVADRLSALGCGEVASILSDASEYGNWSMQVFDSSGKSWIVTVDALGTLLAVEPGF